VPTKKRVGIPDMVERGCIAMCRVFTFIYEKKHWQQKRTRRGKGASFVCIWQHGARKRACPEAIPSVCVTFAQYKGVYIYMCGMGNRGTRKLALYNMNLMDELSLIFKNACSIVSVSWISILIVGRIYDFHVAYISFIERTTSEEWLLQHCQDDHFFHKMAHHTDVCDKVVSNSIIWPSLYGINESMRKMKLCGFHDCSTLLSIVYNGGIPVLFCMMLLYIVTPSFILPQLQRMYNVYCENVLMAKYSPYNRSELQRKNTAKHAMYYDVLDDFTGNTAGNGKSRIV